MCGVEGYVDLCIIVEINSSIINDEECKSIKEAFIFQRTLKRISRQHIKTSTKGAVILKQDQLKGKYFCGEWERGSEATEMLTQSRPGKKWPNRTFLIAKPVS